MGGKTIIMYPTRVTTDTARLVLSALVGEYLVSLSFVRTCQQISLSTYPRTHVSVISHFN